MKNPPEKDIPGLKNPSPIGTQQNPLSSPDKSTGTVFSGQFDRGFDSALSLEVSPQSRGLSETSFFLQAANLSNRVSDEQDIASELVDIGRRVAEGELRDAVTERYVDEANAGDETGEALDDIARVEAGADIDEEVGPESDANYREVTPED